jgi:hypothetical protein
MAPDTRAIFIANMGIKRVVLYAASTIKDTYRTFTWQEKNNLQYIQKVFKTLQVVDIQYIW